MGDEINAAKENIIKIFENLTKKYKDYNYHFGSVFYRNQIDSKDDKNEYFQFTNDIKDLQNKISSIKAYGGGDRKSDWVRGYEITLNNLNWRKGIKLIIHIADTGAHGKEFSKGDKYEEEGPKLISLIKECARQNINIIGFKISGNSSQSFERISEIYNEYKISTKDNGKFIEIYDFIKDKEKAILENFNKLIMQSANQMKNPSYKYLKRLKQILYLPNDLEKDINDKKSLLSILDLGTDNYVIIDDNYKKMILLFYRIKSNIPVIIMGETGCGKTSLIIKLSQLLNNGEKIIEIININPEITDEKIYILMKNMNQKTKRQKELWVFFDEIILIYHYHF